MSNFEELRIRKGKEKAIKRRHPWVFSGAFQHISRELQDGAPVRVCDFKGQALGIGLFRSGSIAVSMLALAEEGEAIEDIIRQRIKAAFAYRTAIGLPSSETNCFRLFFGEGDRLPGLVIDRYDHTAVIQIHHPGWEQFLDLIAESLIAEGGIENVFYKPAEKLHLSERAKGYLKGGAQEVEVRENGHLFKVDWEEGQKTGFFLDQRENRQKLGAMSKGKRVLNTFSYTGGFSVYALSAGASEVVSVDSSEPAIKMAEENTRLNGLEEKHTAIVSDVFEYFKGEKENFDIVILDPPAFSKSRRSIHPAIQAYKRLNLAGMKKVKPGGFLWTFSCSQHMDFQLFEDTIRAAAIEAQRPIRIVDRLSQPADHPVNLYHPEGAYLKGLVLQISDL